MRLAVGYVGLEFTGAIRAGDLGVICAEMASEAEEKNEIALRKYVNLQWKMVYIIIEQKVLNLLLSH